MADPVKKNSNFFSTRVSVVLELLLIASIVGGLVTAYFHERGDNRWAARTETEQAISQLTVMVDRSETHRKDLNIHMPQAQKDERYVPRREVEGMLESLGGEIGELKKEVKESRRDTESMFRQILERMP